MSDASHPRHTVRGHVAFVHPLVDLLVMGGGSIAAYAVFRSLGTRAASPAVASAAATLAWYINWPHFAATDLRLYGSRRNLRQFPNTAWLATAAVIAVTVAAFLSRDVVAPAFVKLYLLWSPYHFSGQTIGITLLYARRAGLSVERWERHALSTFVLCTFALPSARAEVGAHGATFYAVAYRSLGVPSWLPTLLLWLMRGALLLLVVALVSRLARGGRVHPLVLLPAAAQYVWFVAAPAGNFTYLVPAFHSLQYLLIAWCVHLRERQNAVDTAPSPGVVARRSVAWAIAIFFGGALLFWVLPRLTARGDLAFSTAVVLSAVQVHHFFVDGVIWKLRDERGPGLSSTTLGDLAGRTRGRLTDMGVAASPAATPA